MCPISSLSVRFLFGSLEGGVGKGGGVFCGAVFAKSFLKG